MTRMLAVLICCSLPPGLALAEARGAATEEDIARARELTRSAQTHYNLGRFEEAFSDYSEAYELYSVPAFLFNLGQCQRQLGDHERAVFFFEGYLRGLPDAPNRELVEGLIAESQEELERQRQAEPPPEETPPEEPPPEETPPEETPPEETPEPTTTRRPYYRTWWFWTIIGGVVAAGATAGGLGYWAATSEPSTSLPAGSLGTVDRRGTRP